MFDLVSAFLLLSGAVRIAAEMMNGNKDRRGWLVMILSSLLSLVWSTATGAVPLGIIAIITILVAIRGWLYWGRIQDARRLEIHDLRNRLAVSEMRNAELEGKL